jgi:hypothetical protein
MISGADKKKLGTFLKNKLGSDQRYRDLALELGINSSIEPGYLVDYLRDNLAEHEFTAVLEETRTSTALKEVARGYLEEIGYVVGTGPTA